MAKITVLSNILVFLPHYFNVSTHLRHLFSPWKRLVGARVEKGFSLSDYLNELSMNLVSRGIGMFLRLIILFFFLLSFVLFLFVFAPVFLVLAIITAPFEYLWRQIQPEQAKKNQAEKEFVKSHLLDSANQKAVLAWFQKAWQSQKQAIQLFSLENLLSLPPLGRSWHYGFTPNLDDYSLDLTSPLTYKNILLDREEEIQAIKHTFIKSQNANVLLVGNEGVGKQTIIDGLSQELSSGKAVRSLTSYRIIQLNMERILAQKPSFEEKAAFLEELLKEAALAKNIIIVVPDFHQYISSSLIGDFSGVWEKFGKRPLVRLLAVTTPFYYEQLVFHHEKLHSLFERVTVEEPSRHKASQILLEKALVFEKHYRVIIPYETVMQVIERCQYYVTHIPFPEKAISLLDEACVKAENIVTPELIDLVLHEKTKLPVGRLGPHLKHKLLNLERLLGKKIYGQGSAIIEIAKAVRRSYIEQRRKKPLVSLLFLGPTGVGKTETAKQLAEIFFHNQANLLRFDMSFYQNKQNLVDLIGSYQEHTSGLLASSIREKPYSVLLIDEIEKANKDILNIFLTLLDEGYLIDGFGERVDCKNLIFVATSNAASKQVLNWVKQGQSQESLEALVRDYVIDQQIFTPEFLNRFDKALVFAPLGLKTAYEIGYKIAQEAIKEYLEQKKIILSVKAPELRSWIEGAYKVENGAREIGRVIRENLADKVANQTLST